MNQVYVKTRGAVIVTRVSTGEQVKHGTSLKSQLDICRSKAQSLGLPIVAEYEDAGISGGLLLVREGMQSAIADIKAGRATTLICANMSRYSRDVEHQQSIRKDVRQAGGTVVFCDMQFDDTPEGDLAFSIMGGFAEYERKVIRARTMRGRRKRAEEGFQPYRSVAPYGYVIPTKADVLRGAYSFEQLGRYLIDEDKAPIAQRIFEDYASGAHSLPSLARSLNFDGIPTPKGSAFWHATTLRNMLINPVYKGEPVCGMRRSIVDESRIGTFHPINGSVITKSTTTVPTTPDTWIRLSAPALISAATWNQASERLATNQKRQGGNPKRVRMLSGRTVCPHCGAKAIVHSAQSRGKSYPYFVCREYLLHRDRTRESYCSGEVYPIEIVERAVVQAIVEACDSPQAITAALEAYAISQGKSKRKPAAKDERGKFEAQLALLARDEQAAIQAQIEGIKAGASPAAYAAVFGQIAEKRRATEEQLARLPQMAAETTPASKQQADCSDKPQIAMQVLGDVETVLTSPDVSDADKRSAVGMLVEKVVCYKDGAEVFFLPELVSSDTLQSVKVVATTNTTWAQTKAMVARVVAGFGAPLSADRQRKAFPGPEQIAAVSLEEFAGVARMGYRNAAVHSVACAVASGALDLEDLQDPNLPGSEVSKALLALPGIGPYAASCLMIYLGRYDRVNVDSWARTLVGKELGRKVTDKEVHAFFEPYAEWKALAYHFYPWRDDAANGELPV